MINKLFEAQEENLAVAIAQTNGTSASRELQSLQSIASTISASVVTPFEMAGLRPEIAELVAKAYGAGWLDGINRDLGCTLPDVVHLRLNAERDAQRLPAEISMIGGA